MWKQKEAARVDAAPPHILELSEYGDAIAQSCVPVAVCQSERREVKEGGGGGGVIHMCL